MSSTRLLCRLAALLLALMLTPIVAPTVAPAQDQVWVDIGVALWRDGNGTARVAAGFASGYTGGQATNAALNQCQAVGGRGCETKGPWRGCAYVTVGKTQNGVLWAIGASPERVVAIIRNAGAISWQAPIGGCGR
jgi:hypothetical protein